MRYIQAIVRYRIEGEEQIVEVWDDENKIGHLENVDCIRKITLYNRAKSAVFDKFRNLPNVGAQNEYVTYTGDMAHFIVYNW